MRRMAFYALIAGMISPGLAQARLIPIERSERACASCRSLDLAANGVGVSFGNSPRFTGLRFNLVDRDIEEISGISAGVDVHIADGLESLGAAGLSVRAGEISGAALAGALVKAHTLTGFSAGAVNYFDEYQVGLSIGIVNIAQRLNGIQLGIINIARNNSSPFRVLPIINVHFE